MRREPNQKGVNGKPPGKENTETDAPSTLGDDENTTSDPLAPTSNTGAEREDATPETEDEAALSSEQVASDTLAQQVQDLDINEVATQDTNSPAEDGEEEETEDDDGDGEWISSFALRNPAWLSV